MDCVILISKFSLIAVKMQHKQIFRTFPVIYKYMETVLLTTSPKTDSAVWLMLHDVFSFLDQLVEENSAVL